MTGVTSIHGYPIFQGLSSLVSSSNLMAIRPPKMRIPKGENVIASCASDREMLLKIKARFRPDVVIHCAGVCDLDVCEERPEWAMKLNTESAQMVSDVFGDSTYLIYLSSDLVFSGNHNNSSGYTEACVPDPLSVAGKTILGAEHAFLKSKNTCVLRLGLPIGASVTGDKGAIDFIESRFKRNLPVSLFFDEYRSCVDCNQIFDVVKCVIVNNVCGLLNCAGPQAHSLYSIGQWVLHKGGYRKELLKGLLRSEEKNGPPRIGNVALNSELLSRNLPFKLHNPLM